MVGQTISEQVSEYVTSCHYDDLPTDVVEKTKDFFLDFLGICLASIDTPWSRSAIEIVNEQCCKEEASIVGVKPRTSVLNAAFTNGVLAHSIEFDDSHMQTMLHPGSVIIPAALATAEKKNLSGKDLILSVVVGYEVAIRVARSVQPGHTKRGFHITGTVGTFGAAAAASKNLGLKVGQITDALGLAGTQAAGLLEFALDGAMSKRIHAGKAAMNGTLAALLAEKGFTGPSRIFEGDYGFCKAYSSNYDPELITANLGAKFSTREVSLKSYACCGHFQQPIIATLDLVNKYDIKPENVQKIVVSTYESATLPCFTRYDVKTPMEAQMSSMPFAVALALLERPNDTIIPSGFLEFFLEKYDDPHILNLAKKVEIQMDPELEELFSASKKPVCSVKIIIGDGKEYEQKVTNPRFMTKTEAEKKYVYLSSKRLNGRRASKILRIVLNLEQLYRIEELTMLLRYDRSYV